MYPRHKRDLAGLVLNARVIGALRVVFGIDLAIIFLMVNKPGLAGSAVVAGIGLALGVSLAVVSSRRIRRQLQALAPVA